MQFPHYNEIQNSKDWMTFRFESTGPKGNVWKVIQFTPMQKRGYYNLGMGDWQGDERLDFVSTTDNGDRDKVLATVALAVYGWMERFPRRKIIFQGNTASRTRLYRMAINKGWEQLNKVFLIQGLYYKPDGKMVIADYDPHKDFEAYVVQRRPVTEFANPPP